MEHWTEYTRFTTVLPVIPGPLIAIPLFLSLARGGLLLAAIAVGIMANVLRGLSPVPG
jgi:hypothetical protein